MVDDEEAVGAALKAAEDGLRRGEAPIGAAIFVGSSEIASAYTQERALGRRIVHADLLALLAADEQLGFNRPTGPLALPVNLEPCLMCVGAAITLGVRRVVFALESPNDGGIDLLARWHPPVEQPFFARPDYIRGGLLRRQSQELFARYAAGNGPKGMRDWAPRPGRSTCGPPSRTRRRCTPTPGDTSTRLSIAVVSRHEPARGLPCMPAGRARAILRQAAVHEQLIDPAHSLSPHPHPPADVGKAARHPSTGR